MGALSQQSPMVWSSWESLRVAQLQHSRLPCWDALYRADNWIHFIEKEPARWKQWIKRARVHSIKQEAISNHSQHWHDDFTMEAKRSGLCVPAEIFQQFDEGEVAGEHACPRCKKVFETKAGKAVHDFKEHGRISKIRHYLHGTDCPRCHKQYHTSARLQRHFYYSKECLNFVKQNHGPTNLVRPGINNGRADQDRDLPVPVGRLIGPQEDRDDGGSGHQEMAEIYEVIDETFLEAMVEILANKNPEDPIETFDEKIREAAQDSIADLPNLLETLRHFGTTGRDFPEIEEKYTDHQVRNIVRSSVEKFGLEWAVPETTATVSNRRSRKAIFEWWKKQQRFKWTDVQVPRPRSRLLTFIHLFSGHRREGDVESHLANFPMPNGWCSAVSFSRHHLWLWQGWPLQAANPAGMDPFCGIWPDWRGADGSALSYLLSSTRTGRGGRL